MGKNKYTIESLMKELNALKYPAQWSNIFDAVMGSYDKYGCKLIDEEYLRSINEEFHIFTHRFEQILRAAEQIRGNEPLARYLALLESVIVDRPNYSLSMIELPEAPEDADQLGYDLLALFVLPPTVPATFASYRAHNVPEDIIEHTVKEYEICIDDFERRFEKPGFNISCLSWGHHIINADLLRIGRFNFEMKQGFTGCIRAFQNKNGSSKTLMDGIKLHRSGLAFGIPGYQDEEGSYYADMTETDTYWEGYPVMDEGRASNDKIRLNKDEWIPVLKNGDPVISVHIPAGESIKPEICENAFIEADAGIRKWYPEFDFKAYVCFSWMMDPQLSKLLTHDSNITAFQMKFIRFPTVSSGHAVFKFVFLKQYKELQDLPENTSLERALKKHYLDGHHIYEPGGFFLV